MNARFLIIIINIIYLYTYGMFLAKHTVILFRIVLKKKSLLGTYVDIPIPSIPIYLPR